MRKNVLIFLFLFFALSISTLFNGCSSNPVKIQNPVVGIVQLVGNGPDAKLAVNLNDKDIYLLESTKELQAELLNNKNKVCEIIYSDVKNTDLGIILTVKQVIPIKISAPQAAEKLSPGTAHISCVVTKVDEKEKEFLCVIKVIRVHGYGSAVKPIGESSEITVVIAKSLTGNEKIKTGSAFQLIAVQPMGGMGMDNSEIWSIEKIIK
jgi:hypothetical protein